MEDELDDHEIDTTEDVAPGGLRQRRNSSSEIEDGELEEDGPLEEVPQDTTEISGFNDEVRGAYHNPSLLHADPISSKRQHPRLKQTLEANQQQISKYQRPAVFQTKQ